METTGTNLPSATTARLPTLFIPHGGGPCFFMDPPAGAPHAWDGMATYLRGIADSIGTRPKAVLVISAHWETAQPTVTTGARPALLFRLQGAPGRDSRKRGQAGKSQA